jgi:hypothetical protein
MQLWHLDLLHREFGFKFKAKHDFGYMMKFLDGSMFQFFRISISRRFIFLGMGFPFLTLCRLAAVCSISLEEATCSLHFSLPVISLISSS